MQPSTDTGSLLLPLQRLNQELREEYRGIRGRDIPARLKGRFKLPPSVLSPYFRTRPVVAVDGSMVQLTGSVEQALVLLRALAQTVCGQEIWSTDAQLLSAIGNRSTHCLVKMELQVARQAIETWSPGVLLLDGTLLYFQQEDPLATSGLITAARNHNTLLVGIAEEIATQQLAQVWPDLQGFSDRLLLYNALPYGEGWTFPLPHELLWRIAVRWSAHPQPVVIDGLQVQQDEQLTLLSFLRTLVSPRGRGIPLWLDVVDRRVRITQQFAHSLVRTALDLDLQHYFLRTKRVDRVL